MSKGYKKNMTKCKHLFPSFGNEAVQLGVVQHPVKLILLWPSSATLAALDEGVGGLGLPG